MGQRNKPSPTRSSHPVSPLYNKGMALHRLMEYLINISLILVTVYLDCIVSKNLIVVKVIRYCHTDDQCSKHITYSSLSLATN